MPAQEGPKVLTDTRGDQMPGPGTVQRRINGDEDTHEVNPLIRMLRQEVQGNQERQSPCILHHRHQRPFIDGLRDESDPKHRYGPRNGAWDSQEVSRKGRESER